MLALRLENVGADKAVRLGSAGIWRGAVAALNEMHEDLETEAPVSLLPEAERHALEAALLARRGELRCESACARTRSRTLPHRAERTNGAAVAHHLLAAAVESARPER